MVVLFNTLLRGGAAFGHQENLQAEYIFPHPQGQQHLGCKATSQQDRSDCRSCVSQSRLILVGQLTQGNPILYRVTVVEQACVSPTGVM